MNKIKWVFLLSFVGIVALSGCVEQTATQEEADSEMVNMQQTHYGQVQPLPFYDYSIPRNVLKQIYNVVTTEARSTYTIIESVMGETKFHGPSVGYGIPADRSFTNPWQGLQGPWRENYIAVGQAEPDGLFASNNTDGTWVLFVDSDGSVVPIYTEHKVTTFPFAVEQLADGSWVRAGEAAATFKVDLN